MNLLPREQVARLILVEAIRWKWLLLLGFVVICGVTIAAGMSWPKAYSSSVTIYIEQQNIIDPLMEGRAVRAGVQDIARNAREVVYNRSLMSETLLRTGRIEADASADVREQALMSLRSRTTVANPGSNLIHIEYRGGDPQLTFETARTLGELFVAEMLQSQERESNAAFEFIDTQVKKYERELQKTQEELKALREKTPLAQPGAIEQLSQRFATLRSEIDSLEQQLQTARIEESSLEEQLSGEAEVSAIETRAERYRTRIAELQEELETLRLSYHETYPDIVTIKQQIADLREQLRAAESGQASGEREAPPRGNELYRQLQSDLYQVRTRIRTLEARLADARSKLDETRNQLTVVQEVQGEINKLQQDYQVNQDIYEDLLRRRENARVSRNLDSEQQGLTIRIQEPAYLPHSAEGPGMAQFALGGGVLGLALPLGFLVVVLNLDPRIRHPLQLPEQAQNLLLEKIPHWQGRRERARRYWSLVGVVLTGVLFVAAAVLLMWMRATGGGQA